jgi:uncharacterized protein (TIGR02246 family)
MNRLAVIATAFTMISAATDSLPGGEENQSDGVEGEIRAVAEAFVTAFNKGDAEAVANLWTRGGDHVGPRGNLTKGRQSIQKRYEEFFGVNPEVRLKVTITGVRVIGPDTAILDGIPEIQPPLQGPPVQARATIILVKHDQRWLIESARDMMIHTPSNYSQLKELEWMIGSWADAAPDSSDVSVYSTCEWTDNKNFLLRRFSATLRGRIAKSGVQLIGWDPRQDQIRSWVFDTSGGFSEGYWKRDGNRWIVSVSGFAQDGSEMSATNILTRIDDNAFTVQSRNRSIDGRADPDIPEIEIRRAPAGSGEPGEQTGREAPARETILPD